MTPKRPGPPQWLSSGPTRVLLLVLSPVILLLLVLWGLLGRLLTMPARIVAALGVALAWVLYLCIPSIPVSLLDWPLVTTAGLLAMLLFNPAQRWLHVALWIALAAYGIVRASLLDDDGSTARRRLVDTLAVECCVIPLWLFVTKLKLWVAADEATLEAVESKIYQRYVVTDYKVTQVAGLGTIHVPYCGDSSRLPPRNLVLIHGYMAGNAFWAAVRTETLSGRGLQRRADDALMTLFRTCKRWPRSSMWYANGYWASWRGQQVTDEALY